MLKTTHHLKSTVLFSLIIVVWYLLAQAQIWSAFVLPGPEKVLTAFSEMCQSGELAASIYISFRRILIGFVIACLLILFTLLAIRFPETPRVGILRIETTRGDRLFISLLGSAFLCLGWLFFFGTSLWGALILCLVYATAVFRWV